MFRILALLAATLFAGGAPLSAQSQTHGQMTGEVTDTAAIVWTRAQQACFASVQYSTHPGMVGALETPTIVASATRDFTVRIALQGLTPATRYYYRLRLALQPGTAGTLGPIGQFRTAPSPHQLQPVSFAFSGDIKTIAQFDTFSAIAAEQPDFYINLGDFPYCDGAVTMADYWNVHKTVRNSSVLHAMTQDIPWFAVWDDHEVTNNWDAATNPALVQNGIQAFHDMFPIADTPNDIWRQRRFGQGLEVFFLDTRRYRGVNADAPSPTKPFLGPQQMQWLQQALVQSNATWKVIATSVPTFYGGTDSWDGYVHEREQLLHFLRQQDLHNVVFLAADQHLAAIRELREGLLEVQAGPVAQFLGGGLHSREPEQRWHGTVRNFAMVHVDPNAQPSTLRIVFHDNQGNVLREHTATAVTEAAKLHFASDVPEGAFHLANGPFLVRDEGPTAHRDRLHPGNYDVLFRDLPHGTGSPASLPITVPQGGLVRIAADYEDLPSSNPVLFADSFDAPFGAAPGWQIVDQGTGGPSSWLVLDGALSQRTNLGGTGAPNFFGSMAIAGSPAWTDLTFASRFWSTDNDTVGVVFRYQDLGNYYRVRLDAERTSVQLTSFRNGVSRVLAERTGIAGYASDFWHSLVVSAIGAHLRVWRNGELLFDLQDNDHATGKVGLYCWANQFVSFDDIVVRSGDAMARTRTQHFAADFSNGSLAGFSIVDQGNTSGPSVWNVAGGALQQTSNIGDGDGSRAGVPKLGSLAIAGPVLTDQELRVRVRNDDNDAFGAVLRYQDPQNYYRFSLDAERHYRRLVRVVQGQWTVLWEDDSDFLPGLWNELQFSAQGDRLRVQWNGLCLCDVHDSALGQGRAGVYCWASTPVLFDDFVVQAPPIPRAVTVAIASGNQDALQLCAPASAGHIYVLALAAARTPGIALSSLQPNDPRTWELTNDSFFQASLMPSPFLQQFLGALDAEGRAQGTIVYPPIAVPLLGGLQLYAGGITFDPSTGRFGEIFPTVPVVVR
jgi:phosphodiesterase/alkaline phosphatase D-like protein